jgi:GNAT superfamily N-acetyltransferase
MPESAPTDTTTLEKIRHCEIGYPAEFAKRHEMPWGIAYYAPENPTCHDANHALILDPDADADTAIRDVLAFYRSRDRQPRVRASLRPGELEHLGSSLESHGFRYETELPCLWMLHDGVTYSAPDSPRLTIRRATEMNARLRALIHSDGPRPWGEGAIRAQLNREDIHLYVGTVGGEDVAMVMLSEADVLARIDHVSTAPAHRRRGYCTAVLRHAMLAHRRMSARPVYLVADNPEAIRIYQRAGFRDVHATWQHWNAFTTETEGA